MLEGLPSVSLLEEKMEKRKTRKTSKLVLRNAKIVWKGSELQKY